MTKTKNRVVSALVALCLVVGLFGALALAAPVSAKAALADYNAGDVAIINAMIDNNNLTGYSKDDPDSWDMGKGPGFIQWTGTAPNKRVRGIYIHRNNVGTPTVQLTGAISFVGLAELDDVVMSSQTGVTSINADGCAKLGRLSIGAYNTNERMSLSAISLSGCTALKELDVSLAQLTSLDVSGNTALTDVSFGGTNMTATFPGGQSITLANGDRTAAAYMPNNSVHLYYMGGADFTEWKLNKTFPMLYDTSLKSKNCSMDVSGGFTALHVSLAGPDEPDPEPEPEPEPEPVDPLPAPYDDYQDRHDAFWMPVFAQLNALGAGGTLTVDAPRDLDHVRHYIFDALNGTGRTLVVTHRGETYRISGQNLGGIALGNNHVFYPLLEPYRA